MTPEARYTPYHPKWYRRRVSVWWWLQNRAYAGFVLRELTSVAVACAAIEFLWQLRALAAGPEAYARAAAWLATAPLVVLNAVAFLAILYHAVTWFNLAPRAIVVRVRGTRVPDGVIAGLNYLAWVILSGAVAAVLVGR